MADNRVAVRLSIEGAEEVRQALTKLGADGEAALKRINFDTSSSTGVKLFNATLQEGSSIATQYASSLGPLGGILSSLGGGWLAAGAGLGAIAIGTYKAIEASDQLQLSQARVTAILKATGDASGLTSAQIEVMATKISESTLNTRDSVRDAAAELLTFKNVSGDVFERTLSLAADMSAVFKTDLATSAMQLGRALDDPIQGMNSLRRAGLDLSPAQKEVIKDLQQSGDLMGAQKQLAQDLADKLGGAAASQHAGVAGAAHDVAEAWDEMLAAFGKTSGVASGAESSLSGIAGFLQGIKSLLDNPDLAVFLAGGNEGGGYGLGGPAPKPSNPRGWLPPEYLKGPLQPLDMNSMFGPINQQQQNHDATAQALEDAAKQLREQATGTTELQRSINKVLEEAAKAQNLSVDALKKNFPQQTADLTAAATADFNASHTKEFSEQAAKRASDLASQKEYLDQLAANQARADGAAIDDQDKLLEYLTKGQAGYFSIAEQSIDQWYANQVKVLQAEEAAELAALDKKKAGYDKDHVAFEGYEQAKADIAATYAAKRTSIDEQEAQKREQLEREQQGALYELIQKGNLDLNQSLKQVAADGLKGFEDALMSLIEGTGKAGDAFKHMVAGILEELAKLLIEKYVISALAKELDSIIGGLGGGGGGGGGGLFGALFGSANGNAFAGGNVVPFASGGVVDGPVIVPMALMGEAGPEAVMPLKRGADGKLGVAGGGAGDLHLHYAPNIMVGGKVGQEDLDALRAELEDDRARFAERSLKVYAEAKSRRIIK